MRPSWLARMQTAALHQGFSLASQAFRFTPAARRTRREVAVRRDLTYVPGSSLKAHRLDMYRPARGAGPWPLLLYVHGGGFTVCSKESHWMMGEQFAAQGFCVANVNYRLAPMDPYPAALQDVGAALQWLAVHAQAYGGDPQQLVLAGESAGANLVTSLALALAAPRDEPFAMPLHALGLQPRAVLAACGLLQVSDPERFARSSSPAHPFVQSRIAAICRSYLPSNAASAALASPLCALEDPAFEATLPPFLISIGERDPIREDSFRLAAALKRLGGQVTLETYPKAGHAFHAFTNSVSGRVFWQDTFAFLASIFDAPGTCAIL